MKLLIIDDSVDALEVAKVRLARENLDIVCAEGGAAGLEMARREKPDLILLDLEMPDMSRLRRVPRAEGRRGSVHDPRPLPHRLGHGRRQGSRLGPGRGGLYHQAVRRL